VDEHFTDCIGHLRVHGEVFARPIDRGAQATDLARDSRTRFFLPLPNPLDKLFPAQIVARQFLRVELALDHDLRGNTSMVGARQPQGIGAAHAVVAREAVHDGLVKGVTHMQRAGHIRRRQLDREIFPVGVKRGLRVSALFPFRAPMGFNRLWLEALG